jgi:hypothetical protein
MSDENLPKKKYQRRLLGYVSYQPDETYRRIATERTRGIVRGWSAALPWEPVNLTVLAESCYLQGLSDMADAAVKNGWTPPAPPAKTGVD